MILDKTGFICWLRNWWAGFHNSFIVESPKKRTRRRPTSFTIETIIWEHSVSVVFFVTIPFVIVGFQSHLTSFDWCSVEHGCWKLFLYLSLPIVYFSNVFHHIYEKHIPVDSYPLRGRGRRSCTVIKLLLLSIYMYISVRCIIATPKHFAESITSSWQMPLTNCFCWFFLGREIYWSVRVPKLIWV